MGNEVQKDSNVDIIIQLDKNFYYAGQQATGAIFINVKKHVRYDALYLRLQGHQFCQWSEGSSDDSTTYTGKKQIYNNQYIIKKYSNGIDVGNYKYTFSFPLNKELPGTFNDYNFSISYPIKAILVNYNQKKYLKNQYNIAVVELMRYQESRLNNTITTKPKTCSCLEQGQSSLRVEYNTNHAKPGDQIKVNIYANNRNCEADIQSVQFGLYMNIYGTSNQGRFKSYKQPIIAKKLKGCGKHSQVGYQFSFIFPNPKKSLNTAFGQITGNYYTLQTKSHIEGCCCIFCFNSVNQPHVVDNFYIGIPHYQPPVIKMNNTHYISQQNYQVKISQELVFRKNPHLKFMKRPIFQNPQKLNTSPGVNYSQDNYLKNESERGVYPY